MRDKFAVSSINATMAEQSRIPWLDALKGICICFIVLTHYPWMHEERLQYLFPYWIDMAVPIFMIVSGYVNTYSYERHRIYNWNEACDVIRISRALLRLLVPFVCIFLIEMFALGMTVPDGANMTFKKVAFRFIVGGWGPGSYYTPVMIQFIFVFPLLYFIIRFNPVAGLIVCAAFNLIFEICKIVFGMDEPLYRLLLFRYIFAIACGIFLYQYRGRLYRAPLLVLMVLGSSYIVATSWLGYKPQFFAFWTGTSMLAVCYIFPIYVYLYHCFAYSECTKIGWLCALGRASYEIFLVQMCWYFILNSHTVQKIIPSATWQLPINLICCLGLGYIFYRLVEPWTQWLVRRIKGWV